MDALQPEDADIPAEIDFTNGVRGKFFSQTAKLHVPVYLDVEVEGFLTQLAARKGVAVSQLVNELLRRDVAMLAAMQ